MSDEYVPLSRFHRAANYFLTGLFLLLAIGAAWRLTVELAAMHANPGDWLILIFPVLFLTASIASFIHLRRGQRIPPLHGNRKGPRLFFRSAVGGGLVVNIWLMQLAHQPTLKDAIISVIAMGLVLLSAWAFWRAIDADYQARIDKTGPTASRE